MRQYRTSPAQRVAGDIRVPGDKSISHRAIMLGGIATGCTEVEGFLDSEDCLATLRAMQAMGVRVERPAAQSVRVHGSGLHGLQPPPGPLDMGNAGTAMRLYMGLLSGQAFDTTLIGDASLTRRPMERAAVPLRTMGARIETTGGRPPVHIHGSQALHGVRYDLAVPSAQVKSALLLAGLYASGETCVIEHAITRDHSERMLRAFGVAVRTANGSVTLSGGSPLTAARIAVPGDISSAAFFLVAGSIAAREPLLIRSVGINPTRTGVIDILRLMGADLRLHERRLAGDEPVADIEVRPARLRGIEVPRELVPLAIDEFPALFIAAACADGETLVCGAEELRVKESDRIAVMAEGLQRLGIRAEPLPDGMRIQGGPLQGGEVESHGDHRIAMAFAIAGAVAADSIVIRDVENVATSFPGFPETARRVGLAIETR